MYAKIMVAVTRTRKLRATGGTIRGLVAWAFLVCRPLFKLNGSLQSRSTSESVVWPVTVFRVNTASGHTTDVAWRLPPLRQRQERGRRSWSSLARRSWVKRFLPVGTWTLRLGVLSETVTVPRTGTVSDPDIIVTVTHCPDSEPLEAGGGSGRLGWSAGSESAACGWPRRDSLLPGEACANRATGRPGPPIQVSSFLGRGSSGPDSPAAAQRPQLSVTAAAKFNLNSNRRSRFKRLRASSRGAWREKSGLLRVSAFILPAASWDEARRAWGNLSCSRQATTNGPAHLVMWYHNSGYDITDQVVISHVISQVWYHKCDIDPYIMWYMEMAECDIIVLVMTS